MASQFDKIVGVLRKASRRWLDNDVLYLVLCLTEEIRNDLHGIHEANSVRVFGVSGIEIHEDFDQLQLGINYRVSIDKVRGHSFHISESLEKFLEFQGGRFLAERPASWYLLEEQYASDEEATDASIKGFNRLPALLEFLDQISEFSSVRGITRTFVLLGGEKLELPIVCTAKDLSHLPEEGAVVRLRDELLLAPRVKAKLVLYKRATVRYLHNVEVLARFGAYTRGFAAIQEIYSANRDNFVSEFEFDKLNEQFERKRQDYMVKVDAVCGELLGKVLALPVAQAIVVSQYKPGADIANAALFFGSAVVSLLGVAFVSNQIHSIREIRSAALRERRDVSIKYPDLYKRIKGTYGGVVRRLRYYARLLPTVVDVLILLSFMVSAFAYETVSGCGGCLIERITAL